MESHILSYYAKQGHTPNNHANGSLALMLNNDDWLKGCFARIGAW